MFYCDHVRLTIMTRCLGQKKCKNRRTLLFFFDNSVKFKSKSKMIVTFKRIS
jgi:hypothetical protein